MNLQMVNIKEMMYTRCLIEQSVLLEVSEARCRLYGVQYFSILLLSCFQNQRCQFISFINDINNSWKFVFWGKKYSNLRRFINEVILNIKNLCFVWRGGGDKMLLFRTLNTRLCRGGTCRNNATTLMKICVLILLYTFYKMVSVFTRTNQCHKLL